MPAPSSLAASSEDGSQFAGGDYSYTATAHDEHSNVGLTEEISLLGPAIILTEDPVRPFRDAQETHDRRSPFFPPLSPHSLRSSRERPQNPPVNPVTLL